MSSLYPFSLGQAIKNQESSLWQESHREDMRCMNAIEQAIKDNFADNLLNPAGAKSVIVEFGFPRVKWVLANTVQRLEHDGRFSMANKEWAKETYIPEDKLKGVDMKADLVARSHPALLDGFINQVRREFQEQGMFDETHCESLSGANLTGQVAVLKLSALKLPYQKPEYQLFIPDGGFGCSPTANGRSVYGVFLKDGERGSFYRQDFVGLLKPEHLPEWGQERLSEMQQAEQPATESEQGLGEMSMT